MIENPSRLRDVSGHALGEVKVVMPATAGIQVRLRIKFKNRLDSGLRRNDANESRLRVDKFKTALSACRLSIA
jgi:hypothetical protein